MYTGCGHTTELNRDLASKSRLTGKRDLAYNRDLKYFDHTLKLNRDIKLAKPVIDAKNTDRRHRLYISSKT